MKRWWVCGMALAAALTVRAGVVLEMSTTREEGGAPERARILLLGESLRMDEAHGPEGEYRAVLQFHAPRRAMMLLDHGSRQYTILDAESLRALARQVQGMLALLPSQHRAAAEAALGGASAPPRRIELLGQTRTIDGREASGYRVMEQGRAVHEIWAVPASVVRVPDLETRTYKAFLALLTDMASSMPEAAGQVDSALLGLGDIDGFPVLMRALDGSGETTAVRIVPRELDPALFRPPEGYTRVALPLPGLTP